MVLQTKLDFCPFGLEIALKVNDLRFEIYGLHWLNEAIFRDCIGCLGLLFELLEKKKTTDKC